jgi:hypothetical protein
VVTARRCGTRPPGGAAAGERPCVEEKSWRCGGAASAVGEQSQRRQAGGRCVIWGTGGRCGSTRKDNVSAFFLFPRRPRVAICCN